MSEPDSVNKLTHDLSNKLMILEGYISLMQLDMKHATSENVKKLADTLASTTQLLADFRSRQKQQTITLNKNE